MKIENGKLYIDLVDLEHVAAYCDKSLDESLGEELWSLGYTADDYDEIVYESGQSATEQFLDEALEDRDTLALRVRELQDEIKEWQDEYDYVVDLVMALLGDIRREKEKVS